MGEVINLNRYRKEKERNSAAAKARANRAKFGLSSAERAHLQQQKNLEDRRQDGALIELPASKSEDKPAEGAEDQ